jgi:hypothetical protein
MNKSREWQWPAVGPTPVNYGLDTEIFDSERFPHVQTFVREAIQNSLDAREDAGRPVLVRFASHSGPLGGRAEFLDDLRAKKAVSGIDWPAQWEADEIKWLVVEDNNSTGLKGGLAERTSDFWNYWLNFGISNKSGAGRGGRGIGRITFLIASGISTVIGLTRRSDGSLAACGMSLLKPGLVNGDFMSSYAYLAKAPSRNVFELFSDTSFFSDLVSAFQITDYAATKTTGLSLVIPFPHESLTRDAIIAAAIEHFAPAVISGALVVEVDGHSVTADSIDDESMRVALNFPAGPLRDDPSRFLQLIRLSSQEAMFTISIGDPKEKFVSAIDQDVVDKIRASFDKDDKVTLAIEIPVKRNGETTTSTLLGVVSRAPKGKKPIDLFFREGMCLPEVAARNAADVDSVLLSTEGQLATYLNFCEGKAHLGLIENKEVSAKLKEHGFSGHPAIKRMVKMLPDDLRRLVLPDADKPDSSIFSSFFSIPKQANDKKKNEGGTSKKDEPAPGPPPGPIPPPQPQAFRVRDLEDGFWIDSNPSYTNRPVNLRVRIAYADGSRKPKWSKFDFEFRRLTVKCGGTDQPECAGNVIVCRNCESDFFLEVSGFDARRELVTFLEVFHDA